MRGLGLAGAGRSAVIASRAPGEDDLSLDKPSAEEQGNGLAVGCSPLLTPSGPSMVSAGYAVDGSDSWNRSCDPARPFSAEDDEDNVPFLCSGSPGPQLAGSCGC